MAAFTRASIRQAHGDDGGGRADILRLRQLDRQQLHRVCGAELAIGLVLGAQQAAQLRPLGQQCTPVGIGAQRRVGLEPHHGHGGGGRQVMRVDHLQQRLREGRELRLHLHLDAGGQEREALQQALDIGVGDLGAADAEPGRDLGELGRELAAHVAHEGEFRLVQPQQARVHQGRFPLTLGDDRHPGLEFDRGLEEQLLRHGLGPQLPADLQHEGGQARRRGPAAGCGP